MSKIKLYYKIINAVIDSMSDCTVIHNYKGKYIMNYSRINGSEHPLDFCLVRNGIILLYVANNTTIGISNQLSNTLLTYMACTDLSEISNIKIPLVEKLNVTYNLKLDPYSHIIHFYGEGIITTK